MRSFSFLTHHSYFSVHCADMPLSDLGCQLASYLLLLMLLFFFTSYLHYMNLGLSLLRRAYSVLCFFQCRPILTLSFNFLAWSLQFHFRLIDSFPLVFVVFYAPAFSLYAYSVHSNLVTVCTLFYIPYTFSSPLLVCTISLMFVYYRVRGCLQFCSFRGDDNWLCTNYILYVQN